MNHDGTPTYGVIVLTMGQRPVELARALASVKLQEGVKTDIVVVGNGWDPVDLTGVEKTVHLPVNIGIPAGRNAGVKHVTGDLLLFLDDDSWLLDPSFLSTVFRRIAADPKLGMIQPRIVDPARRGEEPTRWIPRIRKGDPKRRSTAFSVLETVVVIPRNLFERTGGWPESLFYAHEGIELAWRVWDQGMRVEYHGDLEIGHPVVEQSRHQQYHYLNARNRVWIARRCLDWPLSWVYVATWTTVQVLRARELSSLRMWFSGWMDGWRKSPWGSEGPPKHLRWTTIVRMARHGRPPVV